MSSANDPADMAEIDTTIAALYRSISFRRGERPDWDGLRSRFVPGARLVRMKPDGPEIMDVESFIAGFQSHIDSGAIRGFTEREIGRRLEVFGRIAHAFSAYEGWHTGDAPAGRGRGINSIQLLRAGARWRVMGLLWYEESPDCPIPARYLEVSPSG